MGSQLDRQPDHDHADAADRVQRATRLVLLTFAVFTLLATNQLLVLADHTETSFAWPISLRPNSGFLGAAYAAGFVLSVLALRQRRWSSVRVSVVTVTTFTVLTLVPTLLHLHRLSLGAQAPVARAAAWVWLVVYVVVPIACVAVIVRQERRRSRPDVVRRPMPAWLAAVLLLQGAALTVAGAILFAGGATVHVVVMEMRPAWPWPVTPLTSQAMGAWLVSFGVAVVLALRERDLSRMFVPAVAYAAFGAFQLVVLLRDATAPGTDVRWLWIDVAVLATIVPTGAYGAWAARRASRATPAGPAADDAPTAPTEPQSRASAAVLAHSLRIQVPAQVPGRVQAPAHGPVQRQLEPESETGCEPAAPAPC